MSVMTRQASTDTMTGDDGDAEEDDEIDAEERYQRESAAVRVQRVCRGHLSRKRAAFIPIWPALPCPLKNLLGFALDEPVSISEQLRAADFKNQIDELENALNDQVESLVKPADFARIWHLVHFATRLGYAYWFQGLTVTASFLWSSVLEVCGREAVRSYHPSSVTDLALKRSLLAHEMLLLGQQSHELYRRGEFERALELNTDAIKICQGQKSKDMVLLFIFKTQNAIIKLANGAHKEALDLNMGIIHDVLAFCRDCYKASAMEPLKSKKEGLHEISAVVEVGLLRPKTVCSHLLVICWHNLAVILAYLGKRNEAHNSSAKALSLLGSVQPSQPVQRHIVNAYVASMRDSMTFFHFYQTSFPTRVTVYQEGFHAHKLENSAIRSRQWLSIVAHCAELSPIWIELKDLRSAWLASVSAEKSDATQVSDLLCLCRSAERQVLESNFELATELFTQAQSKLNSNVPSDEKIYTLSHYASFLYTNRKDFFSAKIHVETALNLCEDGVTTCILQLQMSASLFMLGDHFKAFEFAKTALEKCRILYAEQHPPAEILTVACQIMALTHIFRGQGDFAFKLAQIAQHKMQLCSFYDDSHSHISAVTRTFEVALSMRDLSVHIARNDQIKTTRRAPSQPIQTSPASNHLDQNAPRLSPTRFVPRILLKTFAMNEAMHSNILDDDEFVQGRQSSSQHIAADASVGKVASLAGDKKFIWTGRHSVDDFQSGHNPPADSEAFDFMISSPKKGAEFHKTKRLLRDWGPDPTTQLRQLSKDWSGSILQARSRRHEALLPLPAFSQHMSETLPQRESAPGRIFTSGSELVWKARRGKHLPLQKATERSKLGAFLSPLERRGLIDGMQALARSNLGTQPRNFLNSK